MVWQESSPVEHGNGSVDSAAMLQSDASPPAAVAGLEQRPAPVEEPPVAAAGEQDTEGAEGTSAWLSRKILEDNGSMFQDHSSEHETQTHNDSQYFLIGGRSTPAIYMYISL